MKASNPTTEKKYVRFGRKPNCFGETRLFKKRWSSIFKQIVCSKTLQNLIVKHIGL